MNVERGKNAAKLHVGKHFPNGTNNVWSHPNHSTNGNVNQILFSSLCVRLGTTFFFFVNKQNVCVLICVNGIQMICINPFVIAMDYCIQRQLDFRQKRFAPFQLSEFHPCHVLDLVLETFHSTHEQICLLEKWIQLFCIKFANVSSSLQTNNIRLRQFQLGNLAGALAIPGFEHWKAGTCLTVTFFLSFFCLQWNCVERRWRPMEPPTKLARFGLAPGRHRISDFCEQYSNSLFDQCFHQDELMLKDECILVNYMDEALAPFNCQGLGKTEPCFFRVQVIGHNNKYNCHKFVPGQPRGLLPWPQQNGMKPGKSDSVWI